jgi:phosphatidylserine/phosphatidylglycerophosphate/cardiolipin synthase-like enzyme
MRCKRAIGLLTVWLAAGCGTPPTRAAPPPPCTESAPPPGLVLVETFPIETSLDHPAIPEAHDVWLDMIDGARSRIDLAQFYASNQPDSRLELVVQAIERAAARGVSVRFLADSGFAGTYADTLERLDAQDGIEVRHYVGDDLAGGVLHAKYFVVDRADAFLGSQNFDWRALTHIQELGVRARDPGVVRALSDLFETDWTLAAGGDRSFRSTPPAGGYRFGRGIEAVSSPRGWLPDEAAWDLPRIVELIDSARTSVRVQLLSYRANVEELERSLRAAAARGVDVRVLVSNWCKRPRQIDDIQALARVDGIDVAFMNIPAWSGGFISHARVIHAKYLVVDRARAWVGTSNWSKDYFEASRNVGVIVDDAAFAQTLDDFFADNLASPYAEPVDPAATYEPPRVE